MTKSCVDSFTYAMENHTLQTYSEFKLIKRTLIIACRLAGILKEHVINRT